MRQDLRPGHCTAAASVGRLHLVTSMEALFEGRFLGPANFGETFSTQSRELSVCLVCDSVSPVRVDHVAPSLPQPGTGAPLARRTFELGMQLNNRALA